MPMLKLTMMLKLMAMLKPTLMHQRHRRRTQTQPQPLMTSRWNRKQRKPNSLHKKMLLQ